MSDKNKDFYDRFPDEEGDKKPLSPIQALRRRVLIIVSVMAGVFIILLLALQVARPALEKMSDTPQQTESLKQMHYIGKCMIFYTVRNDSFFPPKLSDLHKSGFVINLKDFDAPELPGKVETVDDIDKFPDYIYLVPPKTKIGDKYIPVLRENREGGITMLISKHGISWDPPLSK